MNPLESILYKTRKSALDAIRELDVQYVLDSEISLCQCNSCGIWLKPSQFKKDLDGLDICNECLIYYGP